ncbi:MAG: outer membrane beta-barrel protein [Gammaproteobacteria bacterium]|jgi:opacity protein-like surface antigen
MPRFLLFFAAFLHTHTTLIHAQEFEITPYIGWRTSSTLEEEATGQTIDLKETRSYGIIVSMQQKPGTNYDFLFSRQNTEFESATYPANTTSLRFDYYHIGGTVFYDHDQFNPFVTGGLGATHISPANDIFSSETRFSLSIGGGLKFPITRNIGMRLEVRGYGTVADGTGSILCANGACIAKFNGSLFMQFEANAGLSVAF